MEIEGRIRRERCRFEVVTTSRTRDVLVESENAGKRPWPLFDALLLFFLGTTYAPRPEREPPRTSNSINHCHPIQ
nr:hypothetical protein Itr_chr14CG05590 [Ipomoea trifida]